MTIRKREDNKGKNNWNNEEIKQKQVKKEKATR